MEEFYLNNETFKILGLCMEANKFSASDKVKMLMAMRLNTNSKLIHFLLREEKFIKLNTKTLLYQENTVLILLFKMK